MSEREITDWIDLSADTAGWTRRPLHRARVDGPWGRRKRWHHWAVTSSREIVTITVADLDYVGLTIVVVIDRATGVRRRRVRVRPLGWGGAWPEVADRGRLDVAGISLHDRGDAASLRAPGIDVEVERPAGWETLGVATAWGSDRFAYSSKHTALPARGIVDGRALAPDALACLDWGRGVWPVQSEWNWASAAGIVDGRVIGVNLGARWTRGVTENAIVIDGRLTKLAAEVTFTPGAVWTIRGEGVDLKVTPETIEGGRVPGLGRLEIAFGRFDGTIAGVRIPGLFGWAEELRVRW